MGVLSTLGVPKSAQSDLDQLSTSSRHPTTLVIFVFIGLRAIFRLLGHPPANSQTPSDPEFPFENVFLTQKRLFPGKFEVWGLHMILDRSSKTSKSEILSFCHFFDKKCQKLTKIFPLKIDNDFQLFKN